MFFVGGTFIWQVDVQNKMNKLNKDRMDERVSMEATFAYDDEEQKYKVDPIKVKNLGTIDVRLVRIWIIDDDNNYHKYIDISYTVPVGSSTSLTQNDTAELTNIPAFDVTTTTYYFKIVTERGNIATTRLMPRAATEYLSTVIMPGASYVKEVKGIPGVVAEIHLEIWNRLDEDQTIDLIVATRVEVGSTLIELIPSETGGANWTLITGDITVGDWNGTDSRIYKKDQTVLIELVNIAGIVVSSYYFTVLPS